MNYRRKSSLEVLNHVSKCYIEREFNSWILQAQCCMKLVTTRGATERPSHLVCSAMSLQGYNVKMNFWREFKSWILQAKCYMKWVITCCETKRPLHLVCSAMSLQGYIYPISNETPGIIFRYQNRYIKPDSKPISIPKPSRSKFQNQYQNQNPAEAVSKPIPIPKPSRSCFKTNTKTQKMRLRNQNTANFGGRISIPILTPIKSNSSEV